MLKIQWGANEHILEGWTNFRNEHDGDIRKPLPFDNDSVDVALISHVLEHVSVKDGFSFLCEANRVLKRGGVIRVTVPDLDKVWRLCNDQYRALLKEGIKTWWPAIGKLAPPPDYIPSDRDAVWTLLNCHGHEAAFDEQLLATLMEAAGFDCEPCEYGKSRHPELSSVDFHHVYMGMENCILESCIVEGTKL